MKSVIIDIAKEVAGFYGLSYYDICEKDRKRVVVEPRQVAHYLCRMHTKKSLAEIGQMVGRKDHATVLHSCKTVRNLMDTDKAFKNKIDMLNAHIISTCNTEAQVEKKIRYNKSRNLVACRSASIRHNITYKVEFTC